MPASAVDPRRLLALLLPFSAGPGRLGRYNLSLKSRGRFISFEGIDGSGKTTQLERLEKKLAAQGYPVVVAQEPGGTRVGRDIRRLLLDTASADLGAIPELLLYFASRAQNIAEVILPGLDAGSIVLCDRFTDATVAYQGYGRELGVDTVRGIERVACHGVTPDLTILLEIEATTGLHRALDRNRGQKFDESRMERQDLQFYQRVQQGYRELSLAEPERIKRVDGQGSVEEVAAAVGSEVDSFLQGRRP